MHQSLIIYISFTFFEVKKGITWGFITRIAAWSCSLAFTVLAQMFGTRAKNKSRSETTVHSNASLNDVAALFILFRYYTG